MLNLFKGLILTYTQNVFKIVVALLFTPFLIQSVGMDQYGIFVLGATSYSYLLFLDSSLKTTFVRFILKKDHNLNQLSILVNSLFISVLFGLLIFLLGLLLLLNIDLFLNESFSNNIGQLRTIIFFFSLSAGLIIFMTPFSAILISHERFVTIQFIELGTTAVSAIIAFSFILNGYGVVEISIVTAFTSALQAFIKTAYAIKFVNFGKINLKVQKNLVLEMIRFSIPIAVAFFAYLIFWRMDYIVLGLLGLPSLVAIYGIALFFIKHLESISVAVSKIAMPRTIKMIDSNITGSELNSILIDISRLQLLILAPILFSLYILGDNFINLWLGEGFQRSYILLVMLMSAYAFELIGWSRNTIMQVYEVYYIRSISLIVFAVINFVASYMIYDIYGLEGVALVTSSSIFLSYLSVSLTMSRMLKMNFLDYLKNVFGKVIFFLIFAIALNLFLNQFSQNTLQEIFFDISTIIVFIVMILAYGLRDNERRIINKIILGKAK